MMDQRYTPSIDWLALENLAGQYVQERSEQFLNVQRSTLDLRDKIMEGAYPFLRLLANEVLVRAVWTGRRAAKVYAPRVDREIIDDLVAEGVEACLKKLYSYRPSRGPLKNFLRMCAVSAMSSYTQSSRFPFKVPRNVEQVSWEEMKADAYEDIQDKEDAGLKDIRAQADASLLKGAIDKVIRTLPERHRFAVTHYFGLNGQDTHTLEEIGGLLNVTPERARQILTRAIGKLRHPSRRKHLVEYCYDYL